MRRLMLVLILVSLVLSACGNNEINYDEVNYYQGSDGLVVEFMENMPPDKVYANEVYPIALRIHNKGAFDILNSVQIGDSMVDFSADITVVYDPFYFNEPEDGLFDSLGSGLTFAGKSPQWPEGESDIVTLGFLQANELEARLGADTQLQLGVCYPYETLLSTPVCIDVDPYNADDRFQTCEQEDLSFSDQGAPVAITNIEVENMPSGSVRQMVDSQVPVYDEQGFQTGYETKQVEELVLRVKPVFRITLENIGEGQIVRGRLPGEVSTCIRKEGDAVFSTSSVNVVAWLGNTLLDCRPSTTDANGNTFSEIKLYEGVGEAVCSVPDEEIFQTYANYQTMLQVYASYVYQSRVSKQVQVEDSIKRYEAPKFEYRCADFHGNYAMCKAYSEQGAQPLDCFYCSATNECLSRSGCGTCPDKSPDDDSRLCVTNCPKPTIEFDPVEENATRIGVSCVNNEGIRDTDQCACSWVYYRFASSAQECSDVENYEKGRSVSSVGGVARAKISLIDALREENILCVAGGTQAGTDNKITVGPYQYVTFD